MRRNRAQAQGWARAAAAAAVLGLSACSTQPPEPPTVSSEPEIVFEPPVQTVEPPTVAAQPEEPPVLPQPPHVAIVVTSGQPAYADIAAELIARLESYELFNLSESDQPPVTVLRRINDSEARAVVAVGLRAAQSSVAMAGVPVIFSQVFNYQDHELVGERSRGVAALAPVDAQMAAWKDIDPGISHIGVIVGQGHDELIADAELAAERHGLELTVRFSNSDQETLYLFKRMVRSIDGYWLIPDNRILSGRILQEMLDEANRKHVAVAVPNESMLEMGATVSFSSVAADIAATIINVLRQIQSGGMKDLPPLSPLTEIRVATNENLLQRRAVAQSATEEVKQ